MNIVVCIKQFFDTEAKKALNDGKVDKSGVNLIMNPYDEFAVEEALRIKEKNGGEVTVLSLGADTQESLRQALAMGVDKAILVNDPALADGDHYSAAVALGKALDGVQYDLILSGWVAIDDNSAQTPSRLAEVLNLPQINIVTKLEFDGGKAVGYREVEGALEVVETSLPAVISIQKGINEPRYPSLKGIMQAKKKEMKLVSLSDLGLDAASVSAKVKILEYSLPAGRKAGVKLEGEPADTAAKLVKLLREEAKII
ncbi:MAG: electron transfer flavoprotein subunit beta/FixA family protein [Bacillota bacterium]